MNPTLNNDANQTGTDNANGNDQALNVRGIQPPVTRVSRRAVMVVGLFGAALALIVLALGFGNHNTARRDGLSDENSIRPSGPIDSVKGLPSDYTFDVNQPGYAALTGQTIVVPSTRPSAEDQALAEEIRQLAELRRKMLEEQRKEQDQALDSPLVFSGIRPTLNPAVLIPTTMPASSETDTSESHTRSGPADVEQNGQQPISEQSGNIFLNHQREKEAFLSQAAAVEPYLAKPLLTPVSAYELKAGSIIPAALVTAINTDLPGQTIGQVTENVYDTVTGHFLLIPQGSRLLGKYQSLVTNGQNRALVVWQRLIFPNGNSIVLDGMPGTDEEGQAGMQDKVDYHFDKLAEAVALTTSIAYAGNLAVNPQSNTYGSQDVVGDTVAQQANRIGENIIERELDVQPTITIRSGWPLRVLVNKDMVLAPYQP